MQRYIFCLLTEQWQCLPMGLWEKGMRQGGQGNWEGGERRREGRGRESSYKFVPPGPHLRKRSDAPVLPQYDSRMIRFHTLKYVRMIPKKCNTYDRYSRALGQTLETETVAGCVCVRRVWVTRVRAVSCQSSSCLRPCRTTSTPTWPTTTATLRSSSPHKPASRPPTGWAKKARPQTRDHNSVKS